MDVQKNICSLRDYYSLVEASPMSSAELEGRAAKYYIQQLFPENQLLCLGKSNSNFFTLTRDELCEYLPQLIHVVPAFMTAKTGMTVRNRPERGETPHLSPRCNANTGPLRYVVFRNREVALNDQARAIIRLARRYRLAMVVMAHPRLIEAWFPVIGWTQDKIRELQNAAIKLGAARKTRIACEHYATPQGRRWHGRHQSVIYFDPAALQS